MPPRATWKGFLNLSLVSVAVKAYTASGEGSKIRLNQLHGECNSRIQYAKKCPKCGDIPNDEIVKGYEYAKDQYAIIDENELEKLRAEGSQRTIAVDKFVNRSNIDPIYQSDSKYYLTPDGPAAQKGFALLRKTMEDMELSCVAKVVLHNKEQLVMLRPLGNVLCMTVLKYASQVKDPTTLDDDIVETDYTKEEQQLARTLIEQTTVEAVDLEEYKDQYTNNLNKLIDAKVNGSQLVTPPAMEAPNVINLMDALKASVSKSASAQRDTSKKSAESNPRPSGTDGPTVHDAIKSKSASGSKKPSGAPATEILAKELSKGGRKRASKKNKSAG